MQRGTDHMETAELIVALARIWGWVGAAVALAFLTIGIDRIDEDAQGAYVFRPLLIPGILLLWPLVLWRWWQIETSASGWAARYRPVRRAHGVAAITMCAGLALILVFGLNARQSWPVDTPPVQLSTGSNP
ncbi:hypothetical protein [Ascidiaceihabitans sp.]|uniref:hypothetical protein n=1 Tax=Ascidiaceihabitans sp. TaxID=1872644 RepID=UPI0032983E20